MADAKLPAPRPKFAALSNARLAASGVEMPTWQSALAATSPSGRATEVACPPLAAQVRDALANRQTRGEPGRIDAGRVDEPRNDAVAADQEVGKRSVGGCSLGRMPLPASRRSSSVDRRQQRARRLEKRLERQPIWLVVGLVVLIADRRTDPHRAAERPRQVHAEAVAGRVRHGIDETAHECRARGASSAYSPRHG